MIPKINSAHGSDTRNIINAAINSLNVQGKSIQDIVAEGQLTGEQFTELIVTVNSLIKKGEVDLDDLSPKVIEAINSNEETSFNLLSIPRDRSVTPEKTTFLKRTRNLLSGDYFNWSLIGGGAARVSKTFDDGGGRLLFAEVEPNTTYTLQVFDTSLTGVLSRSRFAESALHINDLEFDTNGEATILSTRDSFVSANPHTFTTGSNTKYIYLQPSIDGVQPRVQLERGSEASEYIVPFLFTVDMIEGIEQYVRKEEVQDLSDMMWTWHTFPMAIYSETSKKTFVGGVQRGGPYAGHNIYSISEETNHIVGNQLSERFAGDDHNMVALANLPWDNRVMAFYAGHSDNGIYYKYINDYDVNNLSEEHKIPNSEGSTYINVHHDSEVSTMYIITRISGQGITIFYTEDAGKTWENKKLIDGNRYFDSGKRARRDTNLGFTVTGHGGTGLGAIYYGYLTIDGTICTPDGAQIADVKSGEGLPLVDTDLKLVAENAESRTTVTSVDGANQKLTFIHAPDEENFETFNYKYAIYNRDTDGFDIYDIKTGAKGNLMGTTHPHYVGSCYDVGVNSPQIYLSTFNDTTDKWEIWEYSNRETIPLTGWNKVKMAESDLKLFRPIGVMLDRTHRKPIPGFWLKGYFTHYEEYYAEAQMPFDME